MYKYYLFFFASVCSTNNLIYRFREITFLKPRKTGAVSSTQKAPKSITRSSLRVPSTVVPMSFFRIASRTPRRKKTPWIFGKFFWVWNPRHFRLSQRCCTHNSQGRSCRSEGFGFGFSTSPAAGLDAAARGAVLRGGSHLGLAKRLLPRAWPGTCWYVVSGKAPIIENWLTDGWF